MGVRVRRDGMTNRDAIRTLRVIQTDLHLQGYDEAYISALAHAIKLMDMADDAKKERETQ
jgi:hypothetical protein